MMLLGVLFSVDLALDDLLQVEQAFVELVVVASVVEVAFLHLQLELDWIPKQRRELDE